MMAMIPPALYEAYIAGDTERIAAITREMSGGTVTTRKHCKRCDVYWSDETTVCFVCEVDIDAEPQW